MLSRRLKWFLPVHLTDGLERRGEAPSVSKPGLDRPFYKAQSELHFSEQLQHPSGNRRPTDRPRACTSAAHPTLRCAQRRPDQRTTVYAPTPPTPTHVEGKSGAP